MEVQRSRFRFWVESLVVGLFCFCGGGAASSNTSSSSIECPGTPAYISDGDCDEVNNNEFCDFDGGDCCSCTCIDTEQFNCGASGFLCSDPAALCFGDDGNDNDSHFGGDDDYTDNLTYQPTADGEPASPCYLPWIGDGACDDEDNNNPECRYDGGDCCSCTCVVGHYDCNAEFHCIDPAADCSEDFENATSVSADASSTSAAPSNSRSMLTTIFIGVAMGCLFISSIAYVVVSYYHIARKSAAAASNRSRSPSGGATSAVGGLPTVSER